MSLLTVLLLVTIVIQIKGDCQCTTKLHPTEDLYDGAKKYCEDIGTNMAECVLQDTMCKLTPTRLATNTRNHKGFQLLAEYMMNLKDSGSKYSLENIDKKLINAFDSAKYSIENEVFIAADKCFNVIEFQTNSKWFYDQIHERSMEPKKGREFNINMRTTYENEGIGVIFRQNHMGCTAFAISPRHLLTASHCLYDGENLINVATAKIIFPSIHTADGSSVEITEQTIEDGLSIEWIIANKYALHHDLSYDYGIIKTAGPAMTKYWRVGYYKDFTSYLLKNGFRISGYPTYAHYEMNKARLITNPLRITHVSGSAYIANTEKDPLRAPMYFNEGMSGGPFWHVKDDKFKYPIILNPQENRRTVPVVRGIQSGIDHINEKHTCISNDDVDKFMVDGSSVSFDVCPVAEDRVVRINMFRFIIITMFAGRHELGTYSAEEEIKNLYREIAEMEQHLNRHYIM